jgi:hypothetical protein
MNWFSIALLVLSQFATGAALLCLVPDNVLRMLPRFVKLGMAMLLGLAAQTGAGLFLLLSGASLTGWWWVVFGGAGVLLLCGRWKALAALTARGESECTLEPPPVRFLVFAGATVLFVWCVASALFVPTTDYDGIAIWSYRVKVLLHEGSLNGDSLRDPWRIAPMPRHPYFLPVLETAYCLAGGGFSFAASHVPGILLYFSYLCVALGSTGLIAGKRLRAVAAASLLLMPAIAVQFWLEGPREPAIGVYAFAAVYCLALWIGQPSLSLVLLAAVFAVTAQQIKVEGTPIAAGVLAGAFLIAASSDGDRRLRLRQCLVAAAVVAVVALPWYLSRAAIPESRQDYDFTEGFGSNFADRIRALPFVGRMVASEFFVRPELYGIAPFAVVWGLATRWKRTVFPVRLALLIAPGLCLAGILAIYAVRQGQLSPERNVTFSRRIACVMPALVFAALCIPGRRADSKCDGG